MTTIGSTVWLAQLPDVGPFAAVVTGSSGDTLDVFVCEPDRAYPLKAITPWLVEDGTAWGWFEIPPDGQVPADFFEAP